jgi:hypothetical protein
VTKADEEKWAKEGRLLYGKLPLVSFAGFELCESTAMAGGFF